MTATRPCIFIQTNPRQIVGALVAEYSMKRNSAHADAFDVRIMNTEEFPYIKDRDGDLYLRGEKRVPWEYENLQSFTPTRFMPPKLMGYAGRALVVDPDVFAVQDVWPLLDRDMQGHAILARKRSGTKGREGCWATSVMLLECSELTHWDVAQDFESLFRFERDYHDWICLRLEQDGTIAEIEPYWNDFDRLTPETRLLHTTKRQTQPWKTGLPIDFNFADKKVKLNKPTTWVRPLIKMAPRPKTYKQNPDPNQIDFFFGLLKECVEQGLVTEELLRQEMQKDHVRHDAFEVLDRTPPLAAAATSA